MNLPDGFELEEEIALPEGFEVEASELKSVFGAVKNLGQDVVDTVKGIATFGKSMITSPIDTTVNVATNLPGAVVDEAKRIGLGELVTGHPIKAAEKFGEALYEKPLTTVLDVLPVAGAAKGVGAARKTIGLSDDAARAARLPAGAVDDLIKGPLGAPPPVSLPEEAAQILKKVPDKTVPGTSVPPQPAVPSGSTFQETVQNLGKQIPQSVKGPLDEVKSFLEAKYGQLAKKPSWPQELGEMLERKAQGFRLKEMGASPMQLRKLYERFGEQKIRALADLAEQKGITKPVVGHKIGKRIEELSESSGRMIGGIREMASKRGASHNSQALVKAIREQLDPMYLSGSGSAQKGAYMKALQDIEKATPTADGLAKAVTKLNQYATKNKMVQSTGAYSDVANAASKINNELIKKFMSADEWNAYQEALRDFGASEVFKRFYGYKLGREMAGRTGPGGVWNFIKDTGGNKLMEDVFDKVGKRLKTNPEIARDPRLLTKEILDDISISLDEIVENITP